MYKCIKCQKLISVPSHQAICQDCQTKDQESRNKEKVKLKTFTEKQQQNVLIKEKSSLDLSMYVQEKFCPECGTKRDKHNVCLNCYFSFETGIKALKPEIYSSHVTIKQLYKRNAISENLTELDRIYFRKTSYNTTYLKVPSTEIEVYFITNKRAQKTNFNVILTNLSTYLNETYLEFDYSTITFDLLRNVTFHKIAVKLEQKKSKENKKT